MNNQKFKYLCWTVGLIAIFALAVLDDWITHR